MKHFLPILALFIGLTSFAQSTGDVTVFSNTGDQFYVVLNGIRQNNSPETNVKVTNLNNNWYSCKIISANNNFTLEKNIPVKYDTVMTYQIINKKGKYKLRFYSEAPNGNATVAPDQTVVTYHATETVDPVTNNSGNTTNTSDVNINNGSSTTVTTTTTTNTTSSNNGMGTSTTINEGTTGNGESVSINMNVSETGMNVDINANGMEGGTTTTTSSTDLNTSTTTSTTSSSDGSYYEETTTTMSTSGDGSTYYEETTTTVTTTTSGTNDKVLYQDNDMTATIEPVDCSFSDADADQLVKQIENEAFSDDQQRVANMAAKNKCMNTAQISKIAQSFTFAENQLSFMKTAYDNCTDKSNFYQLMNVLTFSSDKEDLEKFINSK
jgi:hypothetical protein